jgi:CelD/BcsL family acetyltransferase involved in cellulose biosynthesis
VFGVTEVSSPSDVEALVGPWSCIARESPHATPFQSEAWLFAWLRRTPVERLRVLVMRDGRDVVAVAPLFAWGSAPARTISPIGVGISDRNDLLAAPGFERVALDAMTEWLSREGATWDACRFEELGPRSLLRDLRAPAGRSAATRAQSVCPVLSLPEAPLALEETIPPAQRLKVHKDRRRARSMGGLDFVRADRTDAMAALDLLFELHAKRWELRGQRGVLAEPAIRELHRDAAERFAARDELRLYVASVGGRPAAVVYGLRWGRRLYLYLQGIEPALERASPGTLVVAGLLEDAIGEGIREVDFLRGAEPYKYAWGAVDEVNECLTIA